MKRLVFIGHRWPEPQSSAAGLRTVQLTEYFHKAGWEVHFVSTASKNDFCDELLNTVSQNKVRANDASFDDFLKKLSPQMVVFDRFMTEEMFGWRVRETCPDALLVLDTQDLHFLRKARKNKLDARKKNFQAKATGGYKDHREKPSLHNLQNLLAKREVASIFRCDLSLIISEFEQQLLEEKFQVPGDLLFYWPLFKNQISKKGQTKNPDYWERKGFMFIGNFQHAPNLDAVEFILREIWPGIEQTMPQEEFHIYGAYAPQHLADRLKKNKTVHLHGRIDNAEKAFQKHRVLLAPLRFGAGIKGKFLNAMENGLPSITTPIGAEGISETENWPGFVAKGSEEIAEKSLELYRKHELWRKMQTKGYTILEEKFTINHFPGKLWQETEKRLQDLENYRQRNFIGQLLNHHQHQSTKFMARWIEEKNKLV